MKMAIRGKVSNFCGFETGLNPWGVLGRFFSFSKTRSGVDGVVLGCLRVDDKRREKFTAKTANKNCKFVLLDDDISVSIGRLRKG